jgi:hypothetical protein
MNQAMDGPVALGAGLDRFLGKVLETLENDATFFAFVFIRRHRRAPPAAMSCGLWARQIMPATTTKLGL